MATIELIDKLRDRADVSYEEAKEALEQCGDDIVLALVMLEKQGKVKKNNIEKEEEIPSWNTSTGWNGNTWQPGDAPPPPPPPPPPPSPSQSGDWDFTKSPFEHGYGGQKKRDPATDNFVALLKKIWRFVTKSKLVVSKEGKGTWGVPVWLLVILCFVRWFGWGLMLLALAVLLLSGHKLRIEFKNGCTEKVNKTLDKLSDMATKVAEKAGKDDEKGE